MGLFDIFRKKTTSSNIDNNIINFGDKNLDDYIRIENKYEKICNQHFKNIEKIEMLYTVANNLSTPNSAEMQKVIDICIEDIKIAPTYMEYCKEMANHYKDDLDNWVPNYVSFQRLAIIYEKQKEYKKAIEVCNHSIKLGYLKDGTKGQMPGRLARLLKKVNN